MKVSGKNIILGIVVVITLLMAVRIFVLEGCGTKGENSKENHTIEKDDTDSKIEKDDADSQGGKEDENVPGNDDNQEEDSYIDNFIDENQQAVSGTEVVVSGNDDIVSGGDVQILLGSREISDISGNTVWRATTISEEEAEIIRGYVKERNEVYAWPNSIDKTLRINELDKQILETAACTFPKVKINFVGDSITEGVGGNVDENGNKISYVNYVQEYLQFGNATNNGIAGRMINDFNGRFPELSIDTLQDSLFQQEYEITVVYAGANDYLTEMEGKNFGVIDSGTVGGYCGQLQHLFGKLSEEYPNTIFFVVTAYQTPLKCQTQNITNFNGTPTLEDYMEPQILLAERYNYPVIDLYHTGFFDTNDGDIAEQFLWDSIHPNDAGYQMLGAHIAAEIVLYCLGITE